MEKFIEDYITKQNIELEEWYEKAIKELPVSEDINIIENIPYIEDGNMRHTMDIYYSSDSESNRPVLISYHGGGLVSGDKKYNRWFCSKMAAKGFLVICIAYPIVPEADVYTLLRDAYTGLKKAVDVASEYKGDTDNISVCGDSAGGFVATYVCAIHHNKSIADALGIKQFTASINALISISGMFYSSKLDKHGILVLRKYFYGKRCKSHPFWNYVNPENSSVYESLPRMLCITSKADYIKDYTLKYVKHLQNNKRSVRMVFYRENKELVHDFVILRPQYEETEDAIEKICEFITQM